MINFTSRTNYYLSSTPTDMRKGRDGLSKIIREIMELNPLDYDNAYIFYSKDYKKVKILHHDLSGFVMYEKWFDDGKFFAHFPIFTFRCSGEQARSLKPEFLEAKTSHKIPRETLILLLSTAVQTKITI